MYNFICTLQIFITIFFVHLFHYICRMTVEEYLKDKCPIDLKRIASLMYPSNVSANAYLSRKLNGARPFTDKDRKVAIKALKSIGAEWNEIDGFIDS